MDEPLLFWSSEAKNVPDVHGTSQRENKGCQKNGGRSPFKLTVLSVIEVCGGNLHEEEDGENNVNYGENHLVDYVLDLSSGGQPRFLDSTCNVARLGGEHRNSEHREQENEHQRDEQKFLSRFHSLQSFLSNKSHNGVTGYISREFLASWRF